MSESSSPSVWSSSVALRRSSDYIHVDHTPSEPWTDWSTEMIVALRERFDKFGVNLEMMHIPLRGRPAIKDPGREGQPNSAGVIFMGESDERNRQIDQACEVIRMAGQAGLRGLNYNITILGHLRTPSKTGRGGAVVSPPAPSGKRTVRTSSIS